MLSQGQAAPTEEHPFPKFMKTINEQKNAEAPVASPKKATPHTEDVEMEIKDEEEEKPMRFESPGKESVLASAENPQNMTLSLSI